LTELLGEGTADPSPETLRAFTRIGESHADPTRWQMVEQRLEP
jgi:hypothetical protein